MAFRRFWLLVEGEDEEIFFQVFKHVFCNKYDFVQTWRYAVENPSRIRSFLRSIEAMNSDYFFLKDINRSPCITARIDSVEKKFAGRIDKDKLIIVVKEIESWYLSGLDDQACGEIGLESFSNTDDITKEIFNQLIPRKFDSRIDFMVEVLKRFNPETAKQKNKSFSYFLSKI